MFREVDGGLKVTSNFENLTPKSKHAYHIHGDCTESDGKTAGTHFHFKGSALNPPKYIACITGNLGDIQADNKGMGTGEGMIKGASLRSTFSILGRSVIMYEKPNDPKYPSIRTTGGRMACGVIGLSTQSK